MLLVNDPNTALFGSLRPPRHSSLWAALQRPFERRATLASEAGEQIPGLRPRGTRWLGAGLLLALVVGLASVGLERARTAPAEANTAVAALHGERLSSTGLSSGPAPARQLPEAVAARSPAPASAALRPPEPALSFAASVAPPATEPRAQPRARAQDVPRAAATSVAATPAAKKKGRAAPLRRELRRALKGKAPAR